MQDLWKDNSFTNHTHGRETPNSEKCVNHSCKTKETNRYNQKDIFFKQKNTKNINPTIRDQNRVENSKNENQKMRREELMGRGSGRTEIWGKREWVVYECMNVSIYLEWIMNNQSLRSESNNPWGISVAKLDSRDSYFWLKPPTATCQILVLS